MKSWKKELRFDPIPALASSGNQAVEYFVKHDLLEERGVSVESLWDLPAACRILRRQQENGSWRYPGGKSYVRSQLNYDQLETYRILGFLVELYGFTRRHAAIGRAADFLFKFQTEEGDFRGIYGTQYTPNYSAGIMELLIKAGYGEDVRIERGFRWLLSLRQNDGGWTIPMRTVRIKGYTRWLDFMKLPDPVQPDKSKPFSHCITGVVLRAFAAHPEYRRTSEAKAAGELLKSRLFQPDKYLDRRAVSFWTGFTFPFWFTDLLSALDSLSLLGFTKEDPQVQQGLNWFRERQQENGLWNLHLLKNKSIQGLPFWVSLAVCRVFKRFYA